MVKRVAMKKKMAIMITAVTLIVAMAAFTVFAAEETGVVITGGALSGGDMTFADFAGVTLNGSDQTTDATWSFADINDGRGTGDGWNLSLTLSQLREYDTSGNTYVGGGKTIPADSVAISTAPVVSLAEGTSSALDTITAVSAGTTLDNGTPVKLLSAATGGGMGSYSIANMVSTLTVRADTYAATYKSDATYALVTGP